MGLSNPANDCFINSILQSLAGLGDLRLYLIRELHRRELDGPSIYAAIPQEAINGKNIDIRNLASLQSGEVTQGLKYMIDKLNERPIYKKTISAEGFIRVLEHAFGTRISKSQQDAQELLQIVAERLAEEFYAGREARKRARKTGLANTVNVVVTPPRLSGDADGDKTSETEPTISTSPAYLDPLPDEDDRFPLEGQTEAQTECQHCQFRPKTNPTSFVMLNLMVPQKSSTTLNECFDAHFKIEFIDDYKCDKCRLQHALEQFSNELVRAKSAEHKKLLELNIDKLRKALQEDPEIAPKDVDLPDIKLAPKRRIARHVQITTFPKVLVIHLSRSIYDPRSSSMKNAAKVAFSEQLPLGGLLNRRNYKLLGMVSHKGTHNSGHYESFRRQHVYPPFSTPHPQKAAGPSSASGTPDLSAAPSPNLPNRSSATHDDLGRPSLNLNPPDVISTSTTSPTASLSSISVSSPSTRPSSGSISGATNHQTTANSITQPSPSLPGSSSLRLSAEKPIDSRRHKNSSSLDATRFRRKKKPHDRWWRISDDKIKECKTSDVLGMQKDVYLLFYEVDRDDDEL